MKNGYLSLWLILAGAFACFFLFSCFDVPEILGVKLKSSGMADVLFAEQEDILEKDNVPMVADSVAEPEKAAPTFPFPVDTASQVFLFIGDSMLDGLSPRLAAYANASGHKLYSVIWYSSTSEIWANSGKLKHYVDSLNPSFIFICLGSNELMVKNIVEKRRGFVEKIVAETGSVPFLWIGPPNWREDTGINLLIRESVPKGSYFKSDGMHFDRRKDGAHPTAASASLWLDSIMRWMPDSSNHPMRFSIPENKTGRPARVFIHSPQER